MKTTVMLPTNGMLSKVNKIFTGIFGILTSSISLSYLGWTFDEPKSIDPSDWKKKWMIFFAWLYIVLYGITILNSFTWKNTPRNPILWFRMTLLLLVILPILTNSFILSYLGTNMNNTEKIDPKDWKRKWIIFFMWLILIGSCINLVNIIYENISHSKQK